MGAGYRRQLAAMPMGEPPQELAQRRTRVDLAEAAGPERNTGRCTPGVDGQVATWQRKIRPVTTTLSR